MRMYAEQTPQEVGFALASMIVVSQSGYRFSIDALPSDMAAWKWQSESKHSTKWNRQFTSSPAPQAFNVIPDETRFQYLVEKWKGESAVLSSTTEMVMLSSYQSIMSMGDPAIPLIFRQLESEGDQPDNWFWALRHMTGTNPVPPENRGNRRAMAAAWLEWARHRYAW